MSPEIGYLLESLATVAVFGGALWLAGSWVRRLGGQGAGRGAPAVEVLARTPLDARRAIYLVRVGERVLVVGATDSALTRLGSTSIDALRRSGVPIEERASEVVPRTRFRDALARALGRAKG